MVDHKYVLRELIGPGKHHLVPAWQPQGASRTPKRGVRKGTALTQHTGLPPRSKR